MNTKITELLGIKYPILQGGMAWIAESTLAAAVSNAGGAGIIAGGSAPAEVIKEEIHKAKALTDKPFGVNIMLMAPNADDLAQLVIDEKIPFITTGAGNPGKYMEKWLEAGIKVIPVVPSVALAKRMERAGAAAVIALYIAFVVRGLYIAKNAPDVFCSLTAIGISAHVGLQAFLNMAVVIGVIPNTGISLPFFSAGGSSLIFLFFEMGILLIISKYTPVEESKLKNNIK